MPRWANVAAAVVALVVLLPVLMAVAVAVALTSHGPVLYRQVRMGRHGRPFVLLKFRTMRVGADVAGRLTLGVDDPRTTPVGRWLRATKLDELPQLVNVLRGDMALVGPRPEVPEFRLTDCPDQDLVLRSLPGLTDPASICFRNEADLLAQQIDPAGYYRTVLLPLKCELSAHYLQRRTPAADMRLLFLTLVVLLRSRRGLRSEVAALPRARGGTNR